MKYLYKILKKKLRIYVLCGSVERRLLRMKVNYPKSKSLKFSSNFLVCMWHSASAALTLIHSPYSMGRLTSTRERGFFLFNL